MKSKNSKTKPKIPEIKEYKNKYRLTAEEIYASLGENNYTNVWNCMTRFRTVISDKKSVDLDKIKKIPLVKGTNWNGQELQIIIGGEVYKIVEEFNKYEQELLTPVKKTETEIVVKKSIWSRFLAFLTGVMGPSIPVLMIAGIFGGIYALLTLPDNSVLQTKLADGTAISMTNLNEFTIWSSLIFVLNKVVLGSLGMFFIYTTTKYFKGNTLLALTVGLTLLSRAFFPLSGAETTDAKFGEWITDVTTNKSGFLLFKLGTYPIVVGGYEGAIIPFIVAGILVTYLDKWIKTWMPAVVDIVFRPTLVYLISMFGLWFILAPIAGLVEYGLVTTINALGQIPYGFGVGFMAMFWQPLVITGAHWAVSIPLANEVGNGAHSLLQPAFTIGAWSQVGAVIGVAIITKNSNLRNISIGTITGGLFGITEPIIYGVTLPKVKPFLWGCVGAFIGGVLSGAFGLEAVRLSGFGIFAIMTYDLTVKTISLALLTWLVAIGGSALLVVIFYKERKNELNYFKKGVKKFIKAINGDKVKINQDFEVYETEIKAMKKEYEKMNKYYSVISKHEQEMIALESKESKHREKVYKKLLRLKAKLMKNETQERWDKFNKLNAEYSTYNLDQQKNEVQNKLNKVTNENQDLMNNFKKQKETIYQDVYQKTNKHLNQANNLAILSAQNIMWNALNSVEIGFEIEDAKPIKFKKEVN